MKMYKKIVLLAVNIVFLNCYQLIADIEFSGLQEERAYATPDTSDNQDVDCFACCNNRTHGVSTECCRRCNACYLYGSEGKSECWDIPGGY